VSTPDKLRVVRDAAFILLMVVLFLAIVSQP
jgi:hypothetical protein